MSFWRSYWLQIKQNIDERSLREKILLLVVIIVVIVIAAKDYLIVPMYEYNKQLQEKITNNKPVIIGLQKELGRINQTIEKDPIKALDKRIVILNQEIEKLKNKIKQAASQLIPPNEMALLLEDALGKSNNIELIKLKNIDEFNIFENEQRNNAAANGDQIKVYKHGLELEFKAKYFDTLEFLSELEKLPWQVLWDQFSYTVEDYPYAVSKLVIYTLSLEKGWIRG